MYMVHRCFVWYDIYPKLLWRWIQLLTNNLTKQTAMWMNFILDLNSPSLGVKIDDPNKARNWSFHPGNFGMFLPSNGVSVCAFHLKVEVWGHAIYYSYMQYWYVYKMSITIHYYIHHIYIVSSRLHKTNIHIQIQKTYIYIYTYTYIHIYTYISIWSHLSTQGKKQPKKLCVSTQAGRYLAKELQVNKQVQMVGDTCGVSCAAHTVINDI